MTVNGEVFIGSKRLRLDPRRAIGKGGEADVYDIGREMALKIYKASDHPDFQNDAAARDGARMRLEEQQQKLPSFPQNLPPAVVAPVALATTGARGGPIRGFAMPLLRDADVLLRYGDRSFREINGIAPNGIGPIFKELHEIVRQVHQAGVVIGDFNDLNVLVKGSVNRTRHAARASENPQVFLIDADSFQFEQFPCRVFTTRFVDPQLCDPSAQNLMLQQPHSRDSDWYAYCVMLMQCLLYVDPYGGLYRPGKAAQRLPHHLRPLHRITVFHPEVRYPKPAVPYDLLPDDLLQFFHLVFEKDHREPFPAPLLETLRWTDCPTCGQSHARPQCPHCWQPAPAAIRQTTVVRGRVTASCVFRTAGSILQAAFQGGRLRYLSYEDGVFKREDGSVVIAGQLEPTQSYRLQGDATLITRNGRVQVLYPSRDRSTAMVNDHPTQEQPVGAGEALTVETAGGHLAFDANESHLYGISAGQLWRYDATGHHAAGSGSLPGHALGKVHIGDVLTGQTRFWVGARFGFGFYRAGMLAVAFVFEAEKGGVNDNVNLPSLSGQVIDAACTFADERCWFLVAMQERGRRIQRCYVVRRDGRVEASCSAEDGDGSWLGGSLHGKWAAENYLLAATDEGIVRVEVNASSAISGIGAIGVTKTFADTELFVNQHNRLFPGPGGLCAVSRHKIQVLTLA